MQSRSNKQQFYKTKSNGEVEQIKNNNGPISQTMILFTRHVNQCVSD